MKNQILAFLAVAALAIGVASCKDDSTSSNNNNNNNNGGGNNNTANTMTFSAQGRTTTNAVAAASVSGGTISIVGVDTTQSNGNHGYGVGIIISNATPGTGTFNVGVNPTTGNTVVMTYSYTDNGGTDHGYAAYGFAPVNGSGTINVTEWTAHSFKATFSGTLNDVQGSSSSVSLTNGSVYVTF